MTRHFEPGNDGVDHGLRRMKSMNGPQNERSPAEKRSGSRGDRRRVSERLRGQVRGWAVEPG